MSSSDTVMLGTDDAGQSGPLHSPTPSPLTTAPPSPSPTPAPSAGFMLASTMTLEELGISDEEDEPEKPADTATKIPAPQVDQEDDIEGTAKAPELTSSCPSSVRSLKEAAPYFGYNSGGELMAVINTTVIGPHVKEFDEVRRLFDRRFKSDEGVNSRPPLLALTQHIAVLNSTKPEVFELKASHLLQAIFPNELDNYAVMLMQFKNTWFNAQGAPLAKQGIPPRLHLERVYTLVKLVDKLVDGYAPMNRARGKKPVIHTPKAPRIIEAKIQADKSKQPLAPPTERQKEEELRRKAEVDWMKIQEQADQIEKPRDALRRKAADEPEDLANTTADKDISNAGSKDPHLRQEATISGLKEREAARERAIADKAERVKQKKKDRRRIREGKPGSITAVKNDASMGYDTSDPKKARRLINTYTTAEWTEDEANPLQKSFHEGYVVGVPKENIQELQMFTETDWICDDDEEEMCFDTGSTSIKEADRELTRGVQQLLVQESVKDALEASQSKRASTTQQATDTTSAGAGSSGENPIEITGDETHLTEAERDARAKARLQYRKDLEFRSKRHHTLRLATGHNDETMKSLWQPDTDKEFTRNLFAEKRYIGLHDTKVPSEYQHEIEADGDDNEDRGLTTDINNPNLRVTVDGACDLMDNISYQPRGYQHYLNITMTPRRKSPRLIGQAPNSYCNMWWQTTAGGELFTRYKRAMEKRISNVKKAMDRGEPLEDARAKALEEVEMGAILADEVGIGKTNTAALYRKVVSDCLCRYARLLGRATGLHQCRSGERGCFGDSNSTALVRDQGRGGVLGTATVAVLKTPPFLCC